MALRFIMASIYYYGQRTELCSYDNNKLFGLIKMSEKGLKNKLCLFNTNRETLQLA